MITVYEAVRGEYVEKKSRFIASLAYVTDEDQADAFIAKIKKPLRPVIPKTEIFILA